MADRDDDAAPTDVVDRAAWVAPPLVSVLVGLLPGTDLAGIVLAIAAVSIGYRWPGHPVRTSLLMAAPAAVVLGVRSVFGGVDELGLVGIGVLGVVSLVMALGFGFLLVAMLAALGTVIAEGRAERRARGPEPWDRARIVATATMVLAAMLFFGVPLVAAVVR
jgi:hypothetical protein